MTKQLVQIYAGYRIFDDPVTSVENYQLANDERLTFISIKWVSSPDCASCGSYPSGQLLFALKLQDYNNRPSRGRKLRSYAVLGGVAVWIVERRHWKLRDWHRLDIRGAGTIEVPRAILRSNCVIKHPTSLFSNLIDFVYQEEPKYIEPLTCPPCFEAVDIPLQGVTDDFDASGCDITISRGSYAVCVPIPNCPDVPDIPVPQLPGDPSPIPIVPAGSYTGFTATWPIPDYPIPCYQYRYVVENVTTATRRQDGYVWRSTSTLVNNYWSAGSCTSTLIGRYGFYPDRANPGGARFISLGIGGIYVVDPDPPQLPNIDYGFGLTPQEGLWDYNIQTDTLNGRYIPCSNNFTQYTCVNKPDCRPGKWNVIVKMEPKASSDVTVSRAPKTLGSVLQIDGTSCCQPNLVEITAANTPYPELWDVNNTRYMFTICGEPQLFNQSLGQWEWYTPSIWRVWFDES